MAFSTKKTLVLLFFLLAISTILLWSYSSISEDSEKSYSIRSFDGSTKILVPEEIITNKDCKAYRKFVQSLVRPGFVPDDSCPWAKVEPVGKFTMNGVKFEVPREYMWLDRKAPDGEVEGLYFMMKYPTMEASSASGDQSYNVKITVKPFVCESDWECTRKSYTKFFSSVGIPSYYGMPQIDLYAEEYKPKLVQHHEDLGLTQYKYKRGVDVFVQGDTQKPDYWLDCGLQRRVGALCKTTFVLSGKLFIEYTFKRRFLLNDHIEVRSKIINKINQFMVKA